MLRTMEIRWFFEGAPPGPLLTWFAEGLHGEPSHLKSWDERNDYYLRFPDCDHAGVKLREGRFEVKSLYGTVEATRFTARVEGKLETWIKLTTRAELDAADRPQEQHVPLEWICVRKQRAQRKYAVPAEGDVRSVLVDIPIERGATVELSELEVLHTPWWTFGFEAFGDQSSDDNLRADLRRVAMTVLESYPGPNLTVDKSRGYPGWLAGLAA
jgi:hypothetical protein